MSVLEDTFKKCLPLLLVPVNELADGDMSQVNAVIKLKKMFAKNPYSAMWAKKAENYRKVIESLGFTVDATDYQELTAIMDPLLDALTLYEGKVYKKAPEIKRVRTGKTSDKRPEIMTDVCIFHSEKEFIDAIMNCGKESVIAFGAIAPFNYMRHDDMYEAVNGIYDERKRNMMRNDNLSPEEYDMSIYEHGRYIALGVKSSETMWIMHMPYSHDMYSSLSNPDSMYCYGERAGYAPYQVFFKEPVSAEKDTSFLAVPKKGFRLTEIMDEMQKVWLPVFLEETVNKFFKSIPEAKDVYLPEEIIAKKGSYEIIPVRSTALVQANLVFDIPAPEEVISNEADVLTLIHHFGITEEWIKDYPVLPKEIGTEEKLREIFLKNVSRAYEHEVRKIAKKLLEEQGEQLRSDITDALFADEAGPIAEAACKGKLSGFTETFIDGKVAITKDWRGRTEEKT